MRPYRPTARRLLGIVAASFLTTVSAAPACDPKKVYTGKISDLSFGFEEHELESKFDTVELDTYPDLQFTCKRCNNGPFTTLARQGNVRGVMTKATVGYRFSILVNCPAGEDGTLQIRSATRIK